MASYIAEVPERGWRGLCAACYRRATRTFSIWSADTKTRQVIALCEQHRLAERVFGAA